MDNVYGVPYLTFEDIIMALPLVSPDTREHVLSVQDKSDAVKLEVLDEHREEILSALKLSGVDVGLASSENTDALTDNIRELYNKYTGDTKGASRDTILACIRGEDFMRWLYSTGSLRQCLGMVEDMLGGITPETVQYVQMAPVSVPLSVYLATAPVPELSQRAPDDVTVSRYCENLEDDGAGLEHAIIGGYVEAVLSAAFATSVHAWVLGNSSDSLRTMFIPKVYELMGREVPQYERALYSSLFA